MTLLIWPPIGFTLTKCQICGDPIMVRDSIIANKKELICFNCYVTHLGYGIKIDEKETAICSHPLDGVI